MLATLAGAAPGFAQTTYIGGGGGSGVTVDLEALNRLGPRRSSGQSALVLPLVSDLASVGVYRPAPTPPLPTWPTFAVVAEPMVVPIPSAPQPAKIVAAVTPPAAPLPAQPLPSAEPVPVPIPEPLIAPEATLPAEPEVTEPDDEPTEVATVAPNGAIDLTRPGVLVTLGFAAEEAELRPEAMAALDAVAIAMAADANARVQLVAFAGTSSSGGSAARRLSLSRALAVRAFLIERGVRSTRIDVRALGAKSDGGPLERVDVVALPR